MRDQRKHRRCLKRSRALTQLDRIEFLTRPGHPFSGRLVIREQKIRARLRQLAD